VIGGGPDGVYYVRQLLRAIEAGRLVTSAIRVVDRDPACAAKPHRGGVVSLETATWADWLDGHLEHLDPETHLVPYHWAPHLLVDWLARSAARAGASVRRAGPGRRFGLPMERDTRDGDRALSYATWMCPLTCIEPDLCPHTRGPKDWSLAGDLAGAGGDWDKAFVFPCFHLVYGVGTIPVAGVQAARDRIVRDAVRLPRRYLVATSSHCHALATALEVGPP
jgi:hypothetical protein